MASNFPTDWQMLALEESMATIIDYRGKTPRKTTSGIPLITAKIVKNGRIQAPEEFIDPNDYDSWMQRGFPELGDVVITTEAPLGEVAQLDGSKVALAQRLITLRGRPGLLANSFLKFVMQSSFVQNQLKARATGTTVLGIKQSELRKISLPIPPLGEQKAIGHILGSLDDKIEINRRMNETLEAMAWAIFKSWFVDFDPVRAKMEGKSTGLDSKTAALFPNSFQNSSLGKIPKGWEYCFWGNIATLEYGKGLREYQGTGEYRVYGTNGPIGWHTDPLCPTSGIIIGRKGAYRGVHFSRHPFYVIDTAFYLKPKTAFDLKWAYYELLRLDINNMDSGSAIPSTSREDFYQIPVCLPTQNVLDSFGSLLEPTYVKSEMNSTESSTLAEIRDTLLPKLVSGEIRVKDAEKAVKAVV
jgi:type I restriction enzyme, S subunit